MQLKILIALSISITAILIAGVSGLYFYIWPTSTNDQSLVITTQVISQLTALKQEKKFGPDSSTFYPGAMDEASRSNSQAAIDDVIDVLIRELPRQPRKSFVLKTFKSALSKYTTAESEERDQFLVYLERIMEIVGVNGSDELLNVWRYGFPYGWFIHG